MVKVSVRLAVFFVVALGFAQFLPRLGPEHHVGEIRFVESPWELARPEVATDGEQFLVLNGGFSAIRISSTGERIDQRSLIRNHPLTHVFFAGDRYIVQERRALNSVRRDGTVTRQEFGELFFTAQGAANGSVVAIPNISETTSGEIALFRIDDHELQFEKLVDIGAQAAPGTSIEVEALGEGFAAVSRPTCGVSDCVLRVVLFRGTGEVTQNFTIPVLKSQILAVASTGDVLLLVWRDGSSSPAPNPLKAAAVTHNGTSAPLTLHPVYGYHDVTVVPMGATFLVLTSEGPNYVATEVAALPAPAIVAQRLLAPPHPYSIPTIGAAYNGDRVLLAFGSLGSKGPLLARLTDRSLNTITSDFSYAAEVPAGQLSPQIATSGESVLIVWQEMNGTGGFDIRGARISRNLNVIEIGVLSTGPTNSVPAVEFGGGTYLVAWRSDHGVRARRVSEIGTLLDAEPIVIDDLDLGSPFQDLGVGRPDIDWNGQQFLIVWPRRKSESQQQVVGARITAQGAVIDSPAVEISDPTIGGDFLENTRTVWTGDSYFIAWKQQTGIGRNGTRAMSVFSARLSADAVRIAGPARIDFANYSPEEDLALAASGPDILLVWPQLDESFPFGGSAVLVGRLLRGLSPGIPLIIAQDSAGPPDYVSRAIPQVIPDDGGFLVMYKDDRNGIEQELTMRRVQRDGAVLGIHPVELGVPVPTSYVLFRAFGVPGLLYARVAETEFGPVSRIYFRFFEPVQRRRAARR